MQYVDTRGKELFIAESIDIYLDLHAQVYIPILYMAIQSISLYGSF